MVNNRIQRTILVVRRATELNPDRAVVGDMVLEFLHQPGFTNPWLATEQDDLAFTGCRLLTASAQEREFFFPAHQWRQALLHRCLKAALHATLSSHAIQGQGC